MSVQSEEFDYRYTEAAATVAARHRTRPANPVGAVAAVLLVPTGAAGTAWRDILTTYCVDHRYAIVAVATTLGSALTLLASGEAKVLVAGKPDHLPAGGTGPRIEFVTHPAHAGDAARRPQRQRPVER